MKDVTNMLEVNGIHHVTAITSDAKLIYDFFTRVLGIRLVKKTVNQDDINTYHLFFADEIGQSGTDMTFFDFRGIRKAVRGTNEISRTGFRVLTDEALNYWVKRLDHYHVPHEPIKTMFGKKVLFFNDFDDQAYAIFSDETDTIEYDNHPWRKGPVPDEYAIMGLGPIFFRVADVDKMDGVLSRFLGMRVIAQEKPYTLYEMGKGGNNGRVIIEHQLMMPEAQQGFGSVHHVAFRVKDKAALTDWEGYLNALGAPNSGYVDRFYFESLYTRLYKGILFEFATEGPGFIDDEETLENLGETLALPPRFRNRRAYVESVVRPIDTKRSDKIFNKEYF